RALISFAAIAFFLHGACDSGIAEARDGKLTPSIRPPAAERPVTTNWRRERFGSAYPMIFSRACVATEAVRLGSRPRRRGAVDGPADSDISAAAADIGDAVDVFVGGVRLFLQQRHRGHDLARLAVAALRHVFGEPSRLHRMELPVGRGEALNGDDVLAGRSRHGNRAGAHRDTADMDGAGAALGDAA